MGNSLLDQLKKTGLVDDKKVQKVKKKKHQQKKKGKKGTQVASVREHVEKVQAEKAARDKQLNLRRKQEQEYKSLLGQIRQLVKNNRVKEKEGELRFHFNDNNKIQRLHITEQLRDQLSCGTMVIVRIDHTYEIVPKAIGEKIAQRAPDRIISIATQENNNPDPNDPYAQYQVPDDLMW